MTYRVYTADSNEGKLLTFDESHVDNDDTKQAPYAVGDTVLYQDLSSRYDGCPCVVVKAYVDENDPDDLGMYIIEPYNDDYYNNKNHISKIGMVSALSLVKIKKEKSWTTEYKGDGRTAAKVNVRTKKTSSAIKPKFQVKRKAVEEESSDGEVNMSKIFSGGKQKLITR